MHKKFLQNKRCGTKTTQVLQTKRCGTKELRPQTLTDGLDEHARDSNYHHEAFNFGRTFISKT